MKNDKIFKPLFLISNAINVDILRTLCNSQIFALFIQPFCSLDKPATK